MSARSVAMIVSNEMLSDPRVEKEAAALAAAGWKVTAVAWGRSGTAPAKETRGSLDIVRTGPVAPYGAGLKSLGLFRAFWADAAREVVALRPDVVHCHDMDTASAGLAALKELPASTKLVLDWHELYRESRMIPRKPLLRRVAQAFVDRLERKAHARASLLIVAAPAMVEERYAAFERVLVVENAPDAERFTPSDELASADRLRVCYVGAKRYAESLELLMRAVQADERFSAYLAGSGVAEAEVARTAAGYDRVDVSGAFTAEEAAGLYAGCDAVFAVYDAKVGNIRVALPVKALEGMAAGLPVIANQGTWFGRMVEREGVGVTVGGTDVDELVSALRLLADDPERRAEMGRRGRAYIEQHMNWADASARLVDAYEHLA